MFKILITLSLALLSLSTLEVYSPECAKKQFNKDIAYTLSNFGQIPYGQTVIGKITIPKDQQLCSIKEQEKIVNKDPALQNILLVKRGTCKFTKKVINAQDLGADLIIIYDNNPGDNPVIIMKNDGHGHLAEIPSLFISNTDGNKLLNSKKQCGTYPSLRVHFDMDQSQESDVTFWLDAGNRQTYILARDFHKKSYFDVLKDRIQLKLGFKVQTVCAQKFCPQNSCVGTIKQKYCRNVPKDENVKLADGKSLILQQLREYFLWQVIVQGKLQKELWWKYMHKFDNKVCIEEKDVEDCSYNTMKQMDISNQVIDKIKLLVSQTIQKLKQGKKTVLKQTSFQARELGIFFYPEVTINGRNFYGLFKAPQVFEAICDSLIDPPQQCISFIRENHQDYYQDSTGGIWGTIFLILGIMTIIFILALFLYTKVIRREMNQQMSLEVNKMVQKYVNLPGKKAGESSASSYLKFDG